MKKEKNDETKKLWVGIGAMALSMLLAIPAPSAFANERQTEESMVKSYAEKDIQESDIQEKDLQESDVQESEVLMSSD